MEENEDPRPVPLYERIYAVIRQIPCGCVATYGQVAAIVGSGNPRTVGYALSSLPDQSDVPWQRVVNRQGRVSPRAEGAEDSRQRVLLIDEGVLFDRRGCIDFDVYGWYGPDIEWLERHDFFPASRPTNKP